MHWMGRLGRLVYITCVTLDVPRGGTTGKLLVPLREKPWTDRFLGRFWGSNQVRSVPSSSDGGWSIPL